MSTQLRVFAATAAILAGSTLLSLLEPTGGVHAQMGGPTATPTPANGYCSNVMDQPPVQGPCDDGCSVTDPPILPPIGDVALPPCACETSWTLYADWYDECVPMNLAAPVSGARANALSECWPEEYSGLYRRPFGGLTWVHIDSLKHVYPGLQGGYEYRVVVADGRSNVIDLSKSCP